MNMDAKNLVMDGTGKITSIRILPPNGDKVRMESTYNGASIFAGHKVTEIVTYEQEEVIPNSMTGFANGQIVANDGGDVLLWRGPGAAVRVAGSSELEWRGYGVMQSRSAKFAEFNGKILDVVVHVNNDGNTTVQASIWK
ncbi:hypothetical protein [Actinosynnema sp. NPDC023587]|uniref:hypothetical protein n=1 Tax=Actinosynnema sp. NPDC023587 TaxID=3154695 RepID=UPI00340F1C52